MIIKKISKKISIFTIFLLSIVIFISNFPLNAAGAYLVDVGDEWTYGITDHGDYMGTEGIIITSIPAPPDYPRGAKFVNGTLKNLDTKIKEKYLYNDTLITEADANFSRTTRTYGGVSCECVHITYKGGYTNVDIATGIVVETYFSAKISTIFGVISIKDHTWVISWSVTEFPEDPEEPSTGGGGAIPGYDLLFIIGIIAVISTVLTIGFKKKFKT